MTCGLLESALAANRWAQEHGCPIWLTTATRAVHPNDDLKTVSLPVDAARHPIHVLEPAGDQGSEGVNVAAWPWFEGGIS